MKERIALWRQVFEQDRNSIQNTLTAVTWDLAAFSCFGEMVRLAPGTADRKHLNGMLLDMLAKGFWSNTMQAVRKLADGGSIHGKRGVCSLRGLIDDARAAKRQLTRRVFVEDIAGLDYDYEATKVRYWEYAFAQQPEGGAFFVPQELQYERSEARHEVFDWLAGVSPASRKPDDLIRDDVFDRLLARIAAVDDVVDHVNVVVAHAATQASREGRVLTRWQLDDAKRAVRALAEVTSLAGSWFCYSGMGTILPHAMFDQFEYLEAPLFAGDKEILRATWGAFETDAQEWTAIDYRLL